MLGRKSIIYNIILSIIFLNISAIAIQASTKIIELEWDNLVPGNTLSTADLSEPWTLGEQRLGEIDHTQIPQQDENKEPAPLVTEYNSKKVKIAGYMVPLDFDATKVKEFLLVPYVGACIHVPPPPGNQIIYVQSKEGIPVYDIYTPIYVTGVIQSGEYKTNIAVEIGYNIKVEQVKEY